MPIPSPVVGLDPHEELDWLPADGEHLPSWLREMAERHRTASQEHVDAVMAVAAAEEDLDAKGRAWRRALREATAVGKPAPERGFNPDQEQAKIEVAREDAAHARDELAEAVIAALAEMRLPERRAELEPFLGECSEALRRSLRDGPQGFNEGVKASLRARLAELEQRANEGEAIEVINETQEDETYASA